MKDNEETEVLNTQRRQSTEQETGVKLIRIYSKKPINWNSGKIVTQNMKLNRI